MSVLAYECVHVRERSLDFTAVLKKNTVFHRVRNVCDDDIVWRVGVGDHALLAGAPPPPPRGFCHTWVTLGPSCQSNASILQHLASEWAVRNTVQWWESSFNSCYNQKINKYLFSFTVASIAAFGLLAMHNKQNTNFYLFVNYLKQI